MSSYVIEMLNITKEFPGIKANDNVTLQLKEGEIHALLGENGAGKSTLMSVLFGLYQAEEGTIKVRGKEVTIKNPNDANALGIGMVHQHFKLVHNFTVAENIVLGYEDTQYGFLKFDEAKKRINDLSEKYKLKVDVNAKIEDISVGQQQRVEILKMLYRKADILIFDEPTAVLTPQEIEELMKIMKNLVKEGKSIVLITHKLNEIKAVADRCTILRKGKYIDTVDVKKTSNEVLAEKMVGRKVSFGVEKSTPKIGDTVLKVENLSVYSALTDADVVKNVSFEAKRGEILCIAGIEGNGQTELIYGIVGLNPLSNGRIILNGKDITNDSIRARSLAGISHIPEDRQRHGLVLDFALEYNFILQNYFDKKFQKNGFLDFEAIREHATKLIDSYDVRSSQGPLTIARSMSGGNQQKAIVGREIDRNNDLLIAVQPTRGLDVGAIEYIHNEIVKQRDAGKAVLLVSLELDEVMNLSDRIIVMYEGEHVGEFDPKKVTENELGLYMSGSKRNDA
ncbi:MAG: ABC transporter ATP-binding protein [Candidatus Izemoplasmataceae bacterium]